MFNLNDYIISELCLSHSTFNRGKSYYHGGRVKDLTFDKKRLRFRSLVSGTENYNVLVDFQRDGDMDSAQCTCKAYKEYWGICKHIVAVLTDIHEKDKAGYFKREIAPHNSKNLLDYFRYKASDIKTPVDIEVNYEYDPSMHNTIDYSSYVNLRMGEDKLYVVKSIKKFFEKYEDGEAIEFGKKFTFDPKSHRFKEEDMEIINLLKEIYEHEKAYSQSNYGYGKSSLFKGKNVMLSSSSLKRFFDIVKDKKFNAIVLGIKYDNVKVIEDDIPIDFTLSKKDRNLILNIDYEGTLRPLVSSGDYFFNEGVIYKISKYQKENFKPFYNIISRHNNKSIKIDEKDNEEFLAQVFPYVKKLGTVKVDERVEESIYKPDIRPEVYLDRDGNKVIANIKFIYGDIIISPFIPENKDNNEKDRILLRDLERERDVITLFEESNFKVKKDMVYLDNEDSIFDFITKRIEKLQEISDVYYSENFKKIKIYDSSSISSGIRLNEDNDLLEFSFHIEGIDDSLLMDVFNGLNQKKKYFKLKDGSFLPLEMKELEKVKDTLDYLSVDSSDFEKGMIKIPKYRALYLDDELKNSGIGDIARNLPFKELVQNIKEPGDIEYNIPKSLENILRGYQNFGFKWLKTLSSYGMGGILADDMGLGKTLQVITFLLSEKLEKGNYPSLVVAPTSLVYNWLSEIEKFTPELKTLVISGNKEERHQVIEDIMDYDVVITSYPLIRRDIELYEKTTFRYCFIDEAQHIKNPLSVNAQSVKDIKAKNYFALTGTPIENSLIELWSIFDFIMPGYLLSHGKFSKIYERPILKEQDKKVLENLRKHITPFILRRLKKDVLKELPDKIENKVVAELSHEQKKIYLSYLKDIKGEIEEEIKDKGFSRSHIKILAGLTRLRQICCHPSVFLEDYKGGSGKMDLLEEIIEDSIDSGHRILLFSQFTSMLKIIKDILVRKAVEYLYLDGSTETRERGRLVREFNDGYGQVFLISLKAGGTGLNLTGADTVIHFDPWWNPAVEDQATDRAYRIGQKNTVHVMKLITKGTIEEKIYKLQEKKKEMINSVIKPGESLISKLSEEEIRNLFEV